MTTPSRTISIAALSASTLLGAVLVIAALEIPVPTRTVPMAMESPSIGPTPADTQERAASAPVAGGMSGQPGAATGFAPGDPHFMPFTVAPSILNRDEVVRAMIRAYPASLRDAGIGGTVRVYFYVDETGIVRATRIDESSGHQALDEAALALASVYRFSAALNRDRPTPVWISFPITFQVR